MYVMALFLLNGIITFSLPLSLIPSTERAREATFDPCNMGRHGQMRSLHQRSRHASTFLELRSESEVFGTACDTMIAEGVRLLATMR